MVLSTTSGSTVAAAIAPFDSSNPLPPTLTIAGLDPIFGTTVSDGNISITVKFDRPIDPGSLAFDFEIYQVDTSGNLTPIDSLGTYVMETPGDDGSSVVLTTTQPLSPGTYSVVLLGGAGITGLDGSAVSFDDQTLGSFTVATPDVGLADATDLGSIGSTPVSVSDTIDPATPFQDVRLYKISLPNTHKTWQLGLEVYASRIGSDLLSTLSLFDSKGNVIATSQTGRSDAPHDPYLFDGLKPGVYYVGVSSVSNVPGTPTGYNPAQGIAGQASLDDAAGNFKLDVVADSADTPTYVKSFFLNYGDPASTTPTGFTMQFSTAINEATLANWTATALKLVDSHGTTWTVHSMSYDEATASVMFQFDKVLPQGNYSVQLGPDGWLVNLANQAPISVGYAPGTLAMFSVGPTKGPNDPHNIGPLPKDVATAGVSESVTLGPKKTTSYRLVILGPGFYDLEATYNGTAPTATLTAGGQTLPVTLGQSGNMARNLIWLNPGVVTIDIASGGGQTRVGFTFKVSSSLWEQLLVNGVGQSSALSLRLINPSEISAGAGPVGSGGYGPAEGVAGVPAPAPSTDGSGAPANPGGTPLTTTSNGPATTSGAPGSSLLVAPSGGLVGHPVELSEQVAVVGPTTPGGSAAMAFNGAGVPQGMFGRSGQNNAGKLLTNGEMPQTEPDQPLIGEEPLQVAMGDIAGDAAPSQVTQLPAVDGMLGKVAGIVAGLFANDSTPVEAGVKVADLDQRVLKEIEGERPTAAAIENPPADETVETAGFSGTAAGFGMATIALALINRKARHWIERRRNRIAANVTTS